MRKRLFKAAHLLSVMNPKGLTTVHTTEATHTHMQIKSPAPSTCSSYLFFASFVKYYFVTHIWHQFSCLLMWIPGLWNGWNLMYSFSVLHCSGPCSCDIIIKIMLMNLNRLQGYSCVHLTCITPNGNKPVLLESVSLLLRLSLLPGIKMEDIKGSLLSV